MGYGDPSANTTHENTSLEVAITGESVVFSANNLFDLTRDEGRLTSCTDGVQATSRPISADLITGATLRYGPHSADSEKTPSGKLVATLAQKQIGCLKLGLRILPRAIQGDTVTLTLRQVTYDDTSITGKLIAELPTKQILLSLGTASICSDVTELHGNTCLTKCLNTSYRDTTGVCQNKAIICPASQEAFNGNCMSVCPANTVRNNFGDCRTAAVDRSAIVSLVASIILAVLLIFFVILLLLKFFKRY